MAGYSIQEVGIGGDPSLATLGITGKVFFANRRFGALILVLLVFCGCGADETATSEGARRLSGLRWQWQYDGQGRLTQIVGPGESTTRISYSETGQGAGGESKVTVDVGGMRNIFAFDRRDRLTSADGASGKISFRYSASGQPLEVVSPSAPTLVYSHDVQGRPTEVRVGGLASILYRYDYLGRVASIATPAGEVTYTYQLGANTVIRQLPNGLKTFWEFDDEGFLVKLTHVDSNNYVLAEFAYLYRPDGLIAVIKESTQHDGEETCRYQYDPMQRLTRVECQGERRSHSYGYDSLGNLAQSQIAEQPPLRFSSTAAGAIAQDSRGEARVDKRGNTRRLPGSPESIDYDFDSAGRLAAVDGDTLRYGYNALGQLTSRTLRGRTTRYLPNPFSDTWQPLWRREEDGEEAVTVWDGRVPLIELVGGRARYRLEDHLGSVRLETDTQGKVVHWRRYAPYGAPEDTDPREGVQPGFAGLAWDSDAKVYHAAARVYDPITARFLQPDPQLRIPDASKLNHSLYSYCGGDPINFVDRSGAEAHETVTLNAKARYLDSLFRTLVYQHFEGFRDRFIPKDWQSPVALNTDPVVRDSVVLAVIEEAWKLSGHNVGEAHRLVDQWRSGRAEIPKRFSSGNVSAHEWQAAENYLFARQTVESGSLAGKKFSKGTLAAVMRLGTATWEGVHLLGESVGIRPGVFIAPFTGRHLSNYSREWLPQTPETIKWQQRGVNDALASPTPLPRPSEAHHVSFWQRLDDFIASPVYGDELRAGNSISPSPVGGVYLGGAGRVLEGLGRIQGVALDEESGKLALIGSHDQRIDLPPLRLADIVTVFRGVFEQGQSPSVTIDPDPRNPNGPEMVVKHGPGTEGTYVGWVLFECDRIMKSYQLGFDNITRAAVQSQVPDYAKTLDDVYFGGAGKMDKPTWERFWIVPAALNRYDSTTGDLSLFELPLKVNTQKMRWEGGKLVDDPNGKSSFGALSFRTWFSQRYDEIADEVRVAPPPDSGIDGPVAVFHELRRIAVIAAIAERLRDMGQSLPAWMRDYNVPAFPTSPTTPSLEFEKTRKDRSAVRWTHIYGGVNLAPADRDVHRYEGKLASGIGVSRELASFLGSASQVAAGLSPKIPELAGSDEATGAVSRIATSDGKSLPVSLLPGSETRALAPNRQSASDMVIPIGLGKSISLTRYYNSYFDPVGEFGKGWTLDLPRLPTTQVPVKRDGKSALYRAAPHLLTPLATVDIVFNSRSVVQPPGIEMHVTKGHPSIAGVAGGRNRVTGTETRQVLFRDGSAWHFDENDRLALVETDGTSQMYVYDSRGLLKKIVGLVGGGAVAEIALEHDPVGRIVKASATQIDYLRKQAPATAYEVHYGYGADGRLASVTGPLSTKDKSPRPDWTYSYDSDRLSRIAGANSFQVSFGYTPQGRLLWEKRGDEAPSKFDVIRQANTFTVATGPGQTQTEKWTYDARLRPLERTLASGEDIQWSYGEGSAVSETWSRNGQAVATRSTNQDGSVEKTEYVDGPSLEVRRDSSSRPTGLLVDGVFAAKLAWEPDGRLEHLNIGLTEVRPRWNKKGWQNGLLISAPTNSRKIDQWLEEEWDLLGRPTKITDSTGFDYVIRYDDLGNLSSIGRVSQDGNLLGWKLERDAAGRVKRIESSWDSEAREYSAQGVLSRIHRERQGATSTLSFDTRGRLSRIESFTGATTKWSYDSNQPEAEPTQVDLPNGKTITYFRKHESGRVRIGPAWVQLVYNDQGRVAAMTWGEPSP